MAQPGLSLLGEQLFDGFPARNGFLCTCVLSSQCSGCVGEADRFVKWELFHARYCVGPGKAISGAYRIYRTYGECIDVCVAVVAVPSESGAVTTGDNQTLADELFEGL